MYCAIIPTLPQEPLLVQALESVFTQTLAPAQVLVVIDEDSTYPASWWKQINSRFPDATLLQHQGRGMASALAAGIEHSRLDYISFLDSDDRWLPHKQEFQIAALQEEPTLDAVACHASVVQLSNNGVETHLRTAPSATFTATTFCNSTFTKFGGPDLTANHFTWLYRWWWHARRSGIITKTLDTTGLIRRIHGENSWLVSNDEAHLELRRELRDLLSTRNNSPSFPTPLPEFVTVGTLPQ
jgi:glycosyltransferase involved in cell wall biosynthesis